MNNVCKAFLKTTLKKKFWAKATALFASLVLTFTSVVSLTQRAEATAGWTQNPANGHSYKVLTSCGSWTACQEAAIAEGGHLVTITSQAENAWLVKTFGGSTLYCIGFTDKDAEGTWQWVNGEEVTYTNWLTGEPNNSGNREHYAHINWGQPGKWNDTTLNGFSKAIIEKDPPTCTAGAKANGTQGTCAEVEIRGGTVQIEAPPTISFGKHTVSGAEQTSEETLTDPNYFTVEDLKGAAAGYYATLQVTDLVDGSKTIAATNLKLKVTDGTVHTLGGPGDANVKVPAKTQDYIEFPSSSPATLLERSADSKGLLGKYGVLPSFQLTIPAYQTLGSYTGTMTYTLIEN